FFFTSKRRHTRFSRDWSSDVCSSDLSMAESSYFLLAATFLPLLLAPVAYGVGRKFGVNAATWFSFGILAISTALLAIPAVGIYTGAFAVYTESYAWGQFGRSEERRVGVCGIVYI